jgi:VanZ family protein
VGLIIVLSLVPGSERPHTGVSGKGEHMMAYAGTGALAAMGYYYARQRLAFWIAVATLSFMLEYLQNYIPGRSPHILDALAGWFGLSVGMALGALITVAPGGKTSASSEDRGRPV